MRCGICLVTVNCNSVHNRTVWNLTWDWQGQPWQALILPEENKHTLTNDLSPNIFKRLKSDTAKPIKPDICQLWKGYGKVLSDVVGCWRMMSDVVGCCRIEVVGGASVCAWRSTEHVRRKLSWKRSLDPCCFRDGCPPRQQPHTLHTHIPEVRLAASTTINNSLIPHWGKVKDATDRLLRVDLKKQVSGESVLNRIKTNSCRSFFFNTRTNDSCWFILSYISYMFELCSNYVPYCMLFSNILAPSCASWWSTLSGLNHLIATWQRRVFALKTDENSTFNRLKKNTPTPKTLE